MKEVSQKVQTKISRILSIDPGYGRVGIAIIDKSEETNFKERLIFSECFETSLKENLTDRCFEIGQHIEHIIELYSPQVCALENVYITKNVKTVLGVSEAKGVIKYACKQKGLLVYEFTPTQIKAAITGQGNADKKQVMWMLPRLIMIPDDKISGVGKAKSKGVDDEMDAIAVGLTFFASNNSLSTVL